MNKIKLDSLRVEMSNYKHRIALLENKRWELNGLIHSSKTSHSDINALRANEAEVLSQMRELSKKLSELQRETRSVEHQIANESKQERERKWLSITHDDLEINMNDIINDLQQLDKSIHEDELELSSFESKRDKTLSIINLADDLQEELKDLCKQKSKIVVDQLTGEKADQLNKAYLAKQQECKSALERANDAKEEFCIIDTWIDALKVKLHNLRQDRDNLKVSYYLQLLHKCILEYTEQADRLLTSLRTIGAVESMIPQYRHGNVAHRLFLRLKDGGLEVPNYAGNTYTPHKLTNLLKDLGPEIRGISDELERKLECDLWSS